jgi:hypothetical protein
MLEQVLTAPETPPEVPPEGSLPPNEDVSPKDDSTPEQREAARAQGWRDTDEYDGEPTKFVGAKEYLDRAEHILPILRARERESRAEAAKLRQDLEDLRKDTQEQIKFADARARKEIQDRYDALKKQRAQAVTDGDGAEFDRIDGEMTALTREAQPKKVEVPPDAHPPALKAASEAFLERNKWFQTDERKNRMAVVMSQEILAKRPDLKNNPEFFPELERQLRKEYPDMFGNARRAAADPMVEGDSRPTAARANGKKGFRDLPKDAQEAAKRQVKNGLCKNEQEYADNYFSTYGDE